MFLEHNTKSFRTKSFGLPEKSKVAASSATLLIYFSMKNFLRFITQAHGKLPHSGACSMVRLTCFLSHPHSMPNE